MHQPYEILAAPLEQLAWRAAPPGAMQGMFDPEALSRLAQDGWRFSGAHDGMAYFYRPKKGQSADIDAPPPHVDTSAPQAASAASVVTGSAAPFSPRAGVQVTIAIKTDQMNLLAAAMDRARYAFEQGVVSGTGFLGDVTFAFDMKALPA